jgi:hypothetical protein
LAGVLGLVAVGDMVAFDLEVAHPLAVNPIIPAVVACRTEVESRGTGRRDLKRPLAAVGVDQRGAVSKRRLSS